MCPFPPPPRPPQCHLYIFHSRLKAAKSLGLLSAIVLCNVFLRELRNAWQVAFHVGVASLSTALTFRRKVQDMSPDCRV